MRSNATQFKGIEQVLAAYLMNDMAAWSLWNGPDLMFASEAEDMDTGPDELRQAIEMLQKGSSEAAYTLKVYKNSPGEIRSNTPYSRAFKFHLFDGTESRSPQADRHNTVMGAINSKFEEMQAAIMGRILDKIEEEDEDEAAPEKPGGLMGVINGLLENPQIQTVVAQRLGSLITNLLGIPQGPQAVAGIEPPKEGQPAAPLSQEQEDKIDEALEILASCDPELGDHLLKIAAIARDTPGKYKMYVTML